MNKFICFSCFFIFMQWPAEAKELYRCSKLTPDEQIAWITEGKLKKLIACGYDVNARLEFDSFGVKVNATALEMMSAEGNLKATKELLANRANPNIVPDIKEGGTSPLSLAVSYNHYDVALALIKAGANVKEVSPPANHTLLMKMSFSNMSSIKAQKLVDILVKKGPDINAKNANGSTALHIAVNRGNLHYAQVLLNKGANACIPDGKGRTVIDLARERGHKDFADFFKEKCQ